MPGDIDLVSVRTIDLADHNFPRKVGSGPDDAAESSAGKSGPQINLGILLVFDSSLSGQQKSDVSNSVLFSQLAADKQSSRKSSPDAWLKVFSQTMSTLGWLESGARTKTYPGALPIDWIQPIEAPLTSVALRLGQSGVRACQNLPGDSDALKLWNTTTADIDGGTFVLSPAQLQNGSPALDVSVIGFLASGEENYFLDYSRNYQIRTSSSHRELNEDIYSQVRTTVIEKLGDRPTYMVFAV